MPTLTKTFSSRSHHRLFTDASLRKQAGIGMYMPSYLQHSAQINGKKDINRAELAAIYAGMLMAPVDHIQVLSDSITAIYLIKGIQKSGKYSTLVDCIKFISYKKFNGCVDYIKVKGHSGVYGNEVADRLAGLASSDLSSDLFYIPEAKPTHDIEEVVLSNIHMNSRIHNIIFS